MTTTGVRDSEVAGYLAEVRAALADLDPATRDGLLEDLPDHLTEVAATDPEPLAARLGPPAVFAAELRSAAGLSAPAVSPSRPNDPTASTIELVRSLLTSADRGIGRLLGYDRLWTLLVELQPTWWIARAVVAGWVFLIFFANVPATMLAMIVLVVLSIRLGRAGKLATTAGPRLASVIVSVACTLPVLVALLEIVN